MVTRWSVEVDRGVCIGASVCANYAPGHFELADGKSRPLAAVIDPDDAVLDAAETCPVAALAVRDADSGALLAPEE
ncbi:ferredoxin [Streptomyces mobaraensis NBRC 13819 = DSM 40847]|uniref:Ferredoxin n=1 Tax=Streptomyces mobaraensis (strain ATCC 29032 / DSM 40847 / JCM 4168 / NBRC 13819 / NCIMB 11159 / IPCR 16-22) TaxID=1223523 RepID=M2ZXT9_STRM1|nr:hypothetical protein H340_25747 [Streptomyces mobaraensis NBRC 13819 = DSM 40847]QTT77405.1 ferredoxin [Streptomyces mobaraensis NBRC 13819 = DSM 40847]